MDEDFLFCFYKNKNWKETVDKNQKKAAGNLAEERRLGEFKIVNDE